ncbi:18268_t:CDS:1, partial [Gigaspora margarita]
SETTNGMDVELVTSETSEITELEKLTNRTFKSQYSRALYLTWDLVKASLNNYAKAARFFLHQKRVQTNDNSE